MIYKNGIKQYSIIFCVSGLLFGLFMGLFNGLKYNSLITGIIAGVISGVVFGSLFTLAIALFSRHMEKKYEHMRVEILKDRKIICEGPANHKINANAIGGWLFLTEVTVEFYPHKFNFGGQSIHIPSNDIIGVKTKLNQLIIQAKSENYIFVVNKSKLWEKSLKETL